MIGLSIGLKRKESDVVGQDIGKGSREVEIQCLRNALLGRFKGLPDDPVAPAGVGIPILVVEVDGHVGVVGDLEIGNLVIVDIVLVDLLGNDEEAHVIRPLQHDLHLVQDELQFLTLVHRPVGLHLHLLQDTGRLADVVLVLLALHDHQHASRVFHLKIGKRVPPGKSSWRRHHE